MYNMYGFNQPYQQPQVQKRYIKCIPVSSFDEARNAMIDFDGSITVFPDLANGKIYTKNINNDGTANINVYALTQAPVTAGNLETRVARLEQMIGGMGNAADATANNAADSDLK